MKIAIIGSRSVTSVDIDKYLEACDEIISGGAKGVDKCAADYAMQKGIPFTEILPNYKLYGKAAPIVRNKEIVDKSDAVLVFWDGRSRGSQFVIKYAEKTGVPCRIVICAD